MSKQLSDQLFVSFYAFDGYNIFSSRICRRQGLRCNKNLVDAHVYTKDEKNRINGCSGTLFNR
jgi:hypothetical protein